ncbi:MAG: bacteriohemerythrin [Alphaproteobacteria bacterium]|nr:bacteriohemerythrin [Rhodospirillales bacterium]MCW9045122.1 bacteriohemerythrin [Alphaproteobacteria bacterium]
MPLITKSRVTTGVFWVNIPEADLRIQCGCPGDSVKHLMKRGFISSTEIDGVSYESGPNAILLSDVAIQNGSFANLAEFPVLQMLYRQGMIIPNHPGNTGAKPLLIGHDDQVAAQMQYIYRGNYGLISEEEILEAGVEPAKAKELMRMKLKFAFGKISHPSELLDHCNVGTNKQEIRNGVSIQRLALNLFEIYYKDETVTVDLNLQPFENYEAPYPLGSHLVNREYFAVIHSGQGDGWDINRPSMGSVLMYQGQIYLVDAGPNLEKTLHSLGIGISEVEGIFHTHCHDDHFAGLTTIIRSDHRVKYFATPLVRSSVSKKLAALLSYDEANFGDYFDIQDLEEGTWNSVNGLEVKPIFSPHPVETSVFVFRAMWKDGYKSYAHFADIASLDVLGNMITSEEKAPGVSQELFDEVKLSYLEPTDIKKIDVGGGMIHGAAVDFKKDISEKIILSHTSKPLTHEEKEIGSGAPFGTKDILIPGNQEFIFSHAARIINAYFPDLAKDQLRMLLNNQMVTFNPETIILKEGHDIEEVSFILTGAVEVINSQTGVNSILSAGAIIGELNGLHEIFSTETYRAASFVQALNMPIGFYRTFVKQNKLFDNISKLQENREFLEKTWLFGEAISDKVKNRIAAQMEVETFDEGDVITVCDHNALTLIRTGSAHHMIGDEVIEALFAGDFFGEEPVLFSTPSILSSVAIEPCVVFRVPIAEVRDIPIVLWKLFEAFKRRGNLINDFEQIHETVLRWRPEYSVNIQLIDNHHKQLVEMSNNLLEALKNRVSQKDVHVALDFLIDYTDYHFREEEALFSSYDYEKTDVHKERHKVLLQQVIDLKEKTKDKKNNPEVIIFLKEWIINHILTADRDYAAYLNTKGVY